MKIEKYMQPQISVKLADTKCAPFRAHSSDAGADLVSVTSMLIYPGEKKLVDTGVSLKIPVGFVGLVFNRSSQGKVEVQIANGTGVIDSAYRGNIKVLLKNNGTEPYEINAFATRIAQLVISPVVLAQFVPWGEKDSPWEDTQRGNGGFGSTGV